MITLDLDEKKVKRSDIVRNPGNKEWWYTGCIDSSKTIYLSFHFLRTPWIDNFTISIFDLSKKEPFVISKKLFLKTDQKSNLLDLEKETKKYHIRYFGKEEGGWSFEFSENDIAVTLDIEPTQQYFTKFENQMRNRYSFLNFMQNAVNGNILLRDKEYKFKNALGYYDHCFGKVPRKTGWHWLAVQNEDTAFVSLVNYGPYAQRYTQILVEYKDGKKEWIRLDQAVTFEYEDDDKNKRWKLTSCDADLQIEILMGSQIIEKIPPLIPVFIDLVHKEYFVRIKGRIKLDNSWMDIGLLHGVLEEHYGKW